MVNHWIEKKNRNDRLEEAQQALQRWCNKTSYCDKYGFYTENTDIFFDEHPEYAPLKLNLKVNWNIWNANATTDATGIPEVTIQEDN